MSCLIVSGIKSRWVRVAVYTLMFWAAYSAMILMMGTQRFSRCEGVRCAMNAHPTVSNDNPVLRGVRDLGLGILSAIPAARRAFIRQAAELTGDVPKLLRGEAI